MELFLFLEDPKSHPKLKLLMLLPLLFALFLLIDGYLPEKMVEEKEYYIYGNTGGGRYSDSGKYLKSPHLEIVLSNTEYYDLDHLQPVQFIKTPLLGTFKSLVYKSREYPGKSFQYQRDLSVYGLHSLWIWLTAGISTVGLLSKHPKLFAHSFFTAWALFILLLFGILI